MLFSYERMVDFIILYTYICMCTCAAMSSQCYALCLSSLHAACSILVTHFNAIDSKIHINASILSANNFTKQFLDDDRISFCSTIFDVRFQFYQLFICLRLPSINWMSFLLPQNNKIQWNRLKTFFENDFIGEASAKIQFGVIYDSSAKSWRNNDPRTKV